MSHMRVDKNVQNEIEAVSVADDVCGLLSS